MTKNHKVLVGPPVRHERDNYKYFSTGDFRVWHVLCDPFILRDDMMEETDEFVMGWEFEDDPVWHARKLQGHEIEIGKKQLGIK